MVLGRSAQRLPEVKVGQVGHSAGRIVQARSLEEMGIQKPTFLGWKARILWCQRRTRVLGFVGGSGSFGGGDSGTLQVRVAGGSWEDLAIFSGNGGGVWTQAGQDLVDYAGQNIQVGFLIRSTDTDPNVYDGAAGWFIEDVQVDRRYFPQRSSARTTPEEQLLSFPVAANVQWIEIRLPWPCSDRRPAIDPDTSVVFLDTDGAARAGIVQLHRVGYPTRQFLDPGRVHFI